MKITNIFIICIVIVILIWLNINSAAQEPSPTPIWVPPHSDGTYYGLPIFSSDAFILWVEKSGFNETSYAYRPTIGDTTYFMHGFHMQEPLTVSKVKHWKDYD